MREFTYRLPSSSCPKCGEQLDAATVAESPTAGPAPGDITVCAYCAGVLQFGPQLELVAADFAVLMQLTPEETGMVDRAVARIKLARSLGWKPGPRRLRAGGGDTVKF